MKRFTNREKQKCAEREWKMRQRVYGHAAARREDGRLTATQVIELDMMSEIADDYREKVDEERLI